MCARLVEPQKNLTRKLNSRLLRGESCFHVTFFKIVPPDISEGFPVFCLQWARRLQLQGVQLQPPPQNCKQQQGRWLEAAGAVQAASCIQKLRSRAAQHLERPSLKQISTSPLTGRVPSPLLRLCPIYHHRHVETRPWAGEEG